MLVVDLILPPTEVITVVDVSTGGIISVADNTPLVEVSLEGPPGASGAASGRYVFHQSSPSASWLINHVLGAYPQVQVLDSALEIMDPDVVHGSPSQVAIIFAAPTTGYAILT